MEEAELAHNGLELAVTAPVNEEPKLSLKLGFPSTIKFECCILNGDGSKGVSSSGRRSAGGGDGRSDRSSSSTQGAFAGKVGDDRDVVAPKCHCGVYAISHTDTVKEGNKRGRGIETPASAKEVSSRRHREGRKRERDRESKKERYIGEETRHRLQRRPPWPLLNSTTDTSRNHAAVELEERETRRKRKKVLSLLQLRVAVIPSSDFTVAVDGGGSPSMVVAVVVLERRRRTNSKEKESEVLTELRRCMLQRRASGRREWHRCPRKSPLVRVFSDLTLFF
ncbi:hypothetical protein PIB30_068314 [Stylosanthes scabra]|uniref:Uncharacterized protein n=1 Tax=Stylosanthes scabra TaxID=79078 RepID=A0ABU6RMU8_9FABA|nr:hypothetical protein [Stylosanthes scabra]